MRGFLSGIFWGGVLSAFGLGVVSQLSDPPRATVTAPAPEAAAEPAPAEPAPASSAPAEPAAPEPVATPAPQSASEPAPEVAEVPADPLLDAPVPKVADTAPVAPVAPGVSADAAVGEVPAVPGAVEGVPSAFDPARPAAPVEGDAAPDLAELPPPPPLTAEEQALLEEANRRVAESTPAGPAGDEGAGDEGAGDEGAAPSGADEPLVAVPEVIPDAGVTLDPADLPEGAVPEPGNPVAPDEGQAEPAPPGEAATDAPIDSEGLADAPVAEPAPEAAPETSPAVAPEATAEARPQPGFDTPVDGVTTGRLPTIAGEAGETAPVPETGVAMPEEPEAKTPLQAFAASYENPSQRPLFAVILRDTGGPDVDRAALAALPFAVTFAIDPTAPDAQTAARMYRDGGKEVVMLATGIPAGATAADLEVTFEAHARALPEAVAVLDPETGGFQNDRPLATQVVPLVGGQGRGLLTWDKGLNAGDQVARREGVPAALLFRRLDAEGEAAPVIRRYLDRAAFKAAQDGQVIVLGDTRPETIAALLEWAVEGRAATVALTPVSAQMRR